jgi:transposase
MWNGPSIKQLRAGLRNALQQRHHEAIFKRKNLLFEWAKEHGHIIVLTPPNRSVLNPIEYAWRHAKMYIYRVSRISLPKQTT